MAERFWRHTCQTFYTVWFATMGDVWPSTKHWVRLSSDRIRQLRTLRRSEQASLFLHEAVAPTASSDDHEVVAAKKGTVNTCTFWMQLNRIWKLPVTAEFNMLIGYLLRV